MAVSESARARRDPIRTALVADIGRLVAGVESELTLRTSTPDPLGRLHTSEGVQLVEWLIPRWLDLWVEGGTTGSTDVDRVRQLGARSAQDDLPLDLIVRAWRLTPRFVIERVQGETGHGLDPLDLLDLAHLMLDVTDGLAEVLEISYQAELLRRTNADDQAHNQLIHDILAGNQGSSRTIEERSAAIGLQLPADPVVFAVVVDQAAMQPPDSDEVEGLVTEHRQRRRDHEVAAVTTAWGAVYNPASPGHAQAVGIGVVVVGRAEARALCAPIAERGWYAAASRVPSWAECAHTFKRVRLALAAAPHWAMVDRHILREGDVRVLEMLRAPGPEPAAGVAEVVLGPLLEPGQAPVLAAVQAFLAEGSAPLAARRLLVHPQTLRRRLAVARELTGRNLQSSWDRFVLDFATTVAASTH